MMADASDQVLLLVRSSDVDEPDPASMSSFVQSFLLDGARLWLEGHCWGFGCTASMLRFLKRPRTYLIAGGQKGVCQLGGHDVDEACRKRCLDRMVCWFRLAIDVCHAEWPYYDTLNALQIFAAAGSQSSSAAPPEQLQSQSLERLANVFGCQPEVLESQYVRHLPIAQAAYSASPGTNLQAWRQAIEKTRRTLKRGNKGDWHSDVIRTVLMHYGACCPSTSALERRFSKVEKLWGTRICNANPSHVRDLLELAEPLTEEEMKKTAEVARDVWRLYYPGVYKKVSATPRIDNGISRKKKVTGLAAFNRSRATAQLRALPGCSRLSEIEHLADQRIASAGSWTPKMQSEHDFQMKKVIRGVGEACQANSVLQSERSLFQEIAMEHNAKRNKIIRNRFLADSRKMERLSPTKPLDFSLGGCVYVEDGCLEGFGAVSTIGCQLVDVSESGIMRIIRQHGMRRVDDPIDAAAGYIIVANLKDPGRANYWVAVLSGCALVTPDYFASAGKSGSCFHWHAAVQIKRDVWRSLEWQRAEPLLASLLEWATRLPASKWRLRSELDSRGYVTKQKKQKTLFGIISTRQKALPTFQALPHAFAQDQLLAYVAKVDSSTSGCVNAGSVPGGSGAASSSTT